MPAAAFRLLFSFTSIPLVLPEGILIDWMLVPSVNFQGDSSVTLELSTTMRSWLSVPT